MTTATQTLRVVALFRVSTEKQASDGASLDAQERQYRSLAAREQWETVATFRGHESATQAASDRRVLQQVLECIRRDRPDAIYVHEQSRLTRGDELEVALLMRELKENRIKIIVSGVVRDLDSIDERFMVGIQSLVDRTESERIKERLMRGKKERAKQGRKNSGPAPYGYRNPPPGNPGRGQLQIVPEEAAVVRRVFEMRIAGKGETAIAGVLNDGGIAPPRGQKWGKSTIRRLLRCPAYTGTSASNVWVAQKGSRSFRYDPKNPKAIVIPSAHPAIIDQATWDEVNTRSTAVRAAVPRLLSGLLYIDGHQATGDCSDGRRYYRGPRGVKGLAWLLESEVDDRVWAALVSLATSEEFVEKLMVEAADPRAKARLDGEIVLLEQSIARNQRKLDTLIDLLAEGELSKDQYRRKSDEARAAISGAEGEVARLRAKRASMDGSYARRVVKAVQTVLAGRTRLTREERSAVLRSLVRRVDVEGRQTGATLARDASGRVVAGHAARWAVGAVTLRLAVGDDGDRAGHKDTTSSDCAQVAGTAGGSNHRSGHLGTTF